MVGSLIDIDLATCVPKSDQMVWSQGREWLDDLPFGLGDSVSYTGGPMASLFGNLCGQRERIFHKSWKSHSAPDDDYICMATSECVLDRTASVIRPPA